MERIKEENTHIYFEGIGYTLYKKIKNKEYKVIKVLKDDQRSYVALLDIDGNFYVYKEPREKNRRKWQRFLSIFRGSESRREFENIKKINLLGFNTAKPYLAVEIKKGLVCVDSYFVCSYIEGRDGNIFDIDRILKELTKIHSLGYLHGDSHIANFMVSDSCVYIIDTKFMRNKYGKFGEVFELIYLEESCGIDIDYDKNSVYYKIAMIFKRYLLWLGDFKKKIRGKK